MSLLLPTFLISTAYGQWPDFSVSEPVLMDIDGSKDAALIVAIEQYESLVHIPGARTNAEDWFQFLRTSLRVPGPNIVRLHDREAKHSRIRSALVELIKRTKSGGRVWFVFIGHGAPSQPSGDGLLVGYDADATAAGLEQRSLRRSELMQILSARAGDKVMGIGILDASFSGKTARGPLAEELPTAAISDNNVPSGAVLITAADDDQFAGPLRDVHPERPAFSYLMIGALRGWADDNTDGRVTAQEAVTYIDATLRMTLHGERMQHPRLDARDPELVLSDGSEEAPDLPTTVAANRDEDGYGPPLRHDAASPAQDSAEPASGAFGDDEALAHGIGSFSVGIGAGAPYNAFVLFGEAAIGLRFGDYVRLSALGLAAASDFSNKDTSSTNPSLHPTVGVTGAGALGVELARTSLISVSADALGGITYIGERCDNAIGDGAGNLICDRVRSSELAPAAGGRLAMQIRVGRSESVLRGASAAQGILISGTALTSKPTGIFGGVFLGYGAW